MLEIKFTFYIQRSKTLNDRKHKMNHFCCKGKCLIKVFRLFAIVFLTVCFMILHRKYKSESKQNLSDIKTNCNPRFPEEKDLFIDKFIWQVLNTSHGHLKFLNAYLDTRPNRTVVRINSNGPKFYLNEQKVFCQFWFDGETAPQIVQATETQSMIPGEQVKTFNKHFCNLTDFFGVSAYFNYQLRRLDPSYLILCPVDANSAGDYPSSVSITLEPCDDPTSNLKIIDNQPPDGIKKEFGVCGKYVNFDRRNFGMKFIEWIHALKILGNHKVHLYNKMLHPEVLDIFNYFKEQDMLEFYDFFQPSGTKWVPVYASLIQINLFTDCFYKVRNLYKFIVIFDVDELLIPSQKGVMNWHEMMENIQKDEKEPVDVYKFKMINYPHFDNEVNAVTDVPENFYMLRHVRVRNSNNFYVS